MIIGFIYFCEFAYISCLLTFLSVALFMIVITSFLWIPLILFWGPSVLLFGYLVTQTKIGDIAIEYPILIARLIIQRYKQPRKFLWYMIFEIIGWLSQTQEITCFNLGYAWITKSGDVPKSEIKMIDEKNRRQYQLYDYCVTNMLQQIQESTPCDGL